MTPDELDRILSSEDSLQPSSGFVMSVMEAIHREAEVPQPLHFPWVRFVVGLSACVIVALSGTILLLRLDWVPDAFARWASLSAIAPGIGYATTSIVVGYAIASIPRLLAATRR
jgi:hypothetical protein